MYYKPCQVQDRTFNRTDMYSYFTKVATGIKHQYRTNKDWEASGTKQYSEERTLTDPEHCIYNKQHKMEQLHFGECTQVIQILQSVKKIVTFLTI